MKRPLNRNSEITMQRVEEWLATFSGYRHNINEGRIDRWIRQFQEPDRDIAARLLDCVDFISNEQIDNACRSLLARLPGWNSNPNLRNGRWVFAPYTASAGESGDSMLHRFRLATRLDSQRFKEWFKYKSELPLLNLGHEDTIVFVDDFSGTGEQVTETWEKHIQELVGNGPTLYLILVAASPAAQLKIGSRTELSLVNEITLEDGDNFFSSQCKYFDKNEKSKVMDYCK